MARGGVALFRRFVNATRRGGPKSEMHFVSPQFGSLEIHFRLASVRLAVAFGEEFMPPARGFARSL